jgi:hypothetical protein
MAKPFRQKKIEVPPLNVGRNFRSLYRKMLSQNLYQVIVIYEHQAKKLEKTQNNAEEKRGGTEGEADKRKKWIIRK